MSNDYQLKFTPIQCTSNSFKSLETSFQNGAVYFLTDTKQVFLIKDLDAIEMCGGTNIIYGNKKIEYENSGQKPNPEVVFNINDLENNELPLINDLILNIDGCFYKVNKVEDDLIETTRVTLQGSGISGGNGDAGGDIGGSYSINVSPSSHIFSSSSNDMFIKFIGYYNGQDDNYINYVSFTLNNPMSETNLPFYEISNMNYSFNREYDINLIDYKDLFGSTVTSIYLNTMDKYGAQRSKKFTIQIVDLSLQAEKDLIFQSKADTYTYSCKIGGARSGITNKKLIFTFYDENNLNVPVITPQEDEKIGNNYIGSWQTNLQLEKLSHGTYLLEVVAEAQVVGTTTILRSNVLTHKIIKFKEPGNPILAYFLPETLEQYTNIPFNYLLASLEDNKNYTMEIKVDGKLKASLNIVTNILNNYNLYFETKGNYNLSISIVELGLEYSTIIDIKEYTGNLPIIDSNNNSLMLYLTPKGQSNDSVNRHLWKDYNGKYTGELINMYYGDSSGWLEDEKGVSYLQLTSGSKLIVPDFYPFAIDPTQSSTINSAMGQGMTIELDFEIDGIVDYDAELIKCISTDVRGIIQVGFSISGNKMRLYNSSKNGQNNRGALSSLNLVEGQRTRLSFVIEPNNTNFPLCLSYINGIISGAAIYGTEDSFEDSPDNPAQLIIDSTYAQIKIYGIRFYSIALNDRNILNNFTASLPTLEEREMRFKSNDVYDDNNKISYSLISAENYNLQIPYMLISGGWKTDAENDKWKLLSSSQIGQPGLPTGKKDYRLIDVSVVYPKNEYFKNYKNYSYVNEFENGLDLINNFGNSPKEKTGCIMYAQGTSSMEYPVKNLRLRFRNKQHHFTVRPDLAPVEIICMKADYMESSGSHNTGAANLIDDLYASASLKSPGQEHFGPTQDNPDRKNIVTCIKGHPCLIFYSESGRKDTYQYIGKYNLNLDKATPEPFGFNHDESEFGYLNPGDEYYAIQYDDDGKKFIGQENPDDGGDYDDSKNEEELKIVQEGEKINSIHCFEFLDNAVSVCNFLRKPKAYIENENGELIPDPTGGYYSYEDTWYGTFQNKESKMVPGWTLGFESRYPEDRIGYHDADMLYPLASWLSELYYLKTEGSSGNGIPSEKDITEANARFKNEYEVYFNKDFLLFYYIVTEALLMADNRVKNMMIASWGKHKVSYQPLKYVLEEQKWVTDLEASAIEKDVYEWYPIFYDMDTMLGLDNTGVNRFNYYDEDTDSSIYNGDEVLWNFVRDNLSLELDQMYRTLENAGLNIDIEESGNWSPKSIIPYFNNNQANMANEAFYNGDAKYKYVEPAINGYFDGLNNQQIKPGEAPYLYAAQGDRSLSREFFITNRIKFLRGKRSSGRFQTNDIITFRWYFPTGKETDFIDENGINHSASISAVPPSSSFNFESLQTCYAGVQLGKNGNVIKERFDGEEEKVINIPEADSANGTEAYLLGINGLKDLGDLSDKYMQKFVMSGKNKLRSLTLGNPHQDYYNPFWRPKDGNSIAIGISGCTYLRNFNLQNCLTYNAGLDFSNCPIIEKILLTGSNTSGLKLPVNGILKELRLPTSITKLNINSHAYLTADKFSLGNYQYGPSKKIGESDGQYIDDFGYLTDICIINTPIDSYKIVSEAISLKNYYFEGFNWEIKGVENDNQYISTKDDEMLPGKQYYIWSEEQNKYIIASIEDFSSKHNIIKEKAMLIENGEIHRIPILDYLFEKNAKKDSVSISRESALSGTITIKAAAKINQFELYQKYHNIYPNVKIEYDEEAIGADNLTKAYTIEFYNVSDVSENTEPYYTVLTDGSYSLKQLTSKDGPAGLELIKPIKQSTVDTVYSFSGQWKKVGTNEIIIEEEFRDIIPKEALKLEPIFISNIRYYPILFNDHLGNLIKQVEYTYNQTLNANKEAILYLSRDESDLQEFERYTFQGWIGEKDFLNQVENPTIIKLSDWQVTYEMSLYPFYKIEDARIVPSNLDYFIIERSRFTFSKYGINENGNEIAISPIDLGEQYCISIKEEYKDFLSGKITLPKQDKDRNYITAVNTMSNLKNVSQVFFEDGSQYKIIGGESFKSNQNLKNIYIPQSMSNTLKYLGTRAFEGLSNLISFTNFPDSIEHIGERCFANCTQLILKSLPEKLSYLGPGVFVNNKLEIEVLPKGLTQILSDTFKYCNFLDLRYFGTSDNESTTEIENNITHIGKNAFSQTGFLSEITDIYLNNSIVHLGEGCFYNYGAENLTVHNNSSVLNVDNSITFFGPDINISFAQETTV